MGYNIITGGQPLINNTFETWERGYVKDPQGGGQYARRRPAGHFSAAAAPP